jgi:hypothetical protein
MSTTDHDLDDNRQEDHDWDNPPGGVPLPRRGRRWLTPGSTLLLALALGFIGFYAGVREKRPTPPVPDPRGPAPPDRCPGPGRRRRAPPAASPPGPCPASTATRSTSRSRRARPSRSSCFRPPPSASHSWSAAARFAPATPSRSKASKAAAARSNPARSATPETPALARQPRARPTRQRAPGDRWRHARRTRSGAVGSRGVGGYRRPPGKDARRNGPRDAERSEAHKSTLDELRGSSAPLPVPEPTECAFGRRDASSETLAALISGGSGRGGAARALWPAASAVVTAGAPMSRTGQVM